MGNLIEAYECNNELLDNTRNMDIFNFYNAKIEIKKKNYDEALSILETISKENLKIYKQMLYKKICVLIKKERYEEAYDTFMMLKECDYNKIYENRYILLEKYLKDKLNKPCDIEPQYYSEKLLFNYDYNRVINHIKKHKEEDNNKLNHTIFNSNINVEKLYDYAINNLNDDNFLYNSFLDFYILDYPNIGSDNDKTLNYLEVITLPNSKQIITMFPCDKYVNESYIKPENEKTKRLSRIDKFNRKYNM